jgi:CRISPR system Cascade subunit CasC
MNLVEVHILQPVPPANLNRDDTGSPKDAVFGGARRARISSQAQKRAVRDAFRVLIPTAPLAVRTRLLVNELVKLFPDRPESEARAVVRTALGGVGLKTDAEDRTEYLLFLGRQEIDELAKIINIKENWDALRSIEHASAASGGKPKKTAKDQVPSDARRALERVLNGGKAVDLALFGRMLADRPELRRDAACQVAHAISTHRVDREFDFYTAVDDLSPREETGAGMMGDVEYCAATFYRYANVNLGLLRENLHNDAALAARTVEAFLDAFIRTLPRGKQNAFAAHSLPAFVGFLARENASPRSLAAAFERPVFARDGKSLTGASVEALLEYWKRIDDAYGRPKSERVAIVNLSDAELPYHKDKLRDSVEDAIKTVMDAVAQLLTADGDGDAHPAA